MKTAMVKSSPALSGREAVSPKQPAPVRWHPKQNMRQTKHLRFPPRALSSHGVRYPVEPDHTFVI